MMIAFDVKYGKIIRSGTKYYFEVRIRNPNDSVLTSVNIIIRRPSSSLCPIHILDWWSRDNGNPPDEKWNFYYFPEKDILPGEIKNKRIAFDVSPAINLGVDILYVSVMAKKEGSAYYQAVKWKKLFLIILPKRKMKRITKQFSKGKSLWDYLPPLTKYGWKLVYSSPERRNVQGFIKGISATYSLKEKTVGIFILSFDSGMYAERHFQEKITEWREKSSRAGEESFLIYDGLRINRYIFPKNGVIFSWILQSFIFVIYAPTAEEEDLRKIVNLTVFGFK